MAGVKGRSGRKGHYDELAIAEVVNLSLKAVREYLESKNTSLEDKAKLGQAFVGKIIPQHIIGEGFDNSKIIIIQKDKTEVQSGNKSTPVSVRLSQ